MTAFRLRPLPLLALVLLASPLAAQEVVQPLPGTTDADALAADMRTIAANPRDVDALVDAARLSLKLDDVRAAGALLQRAENANPRDPRVKAGQASVLVESERPGQALRYFADAEAQGLDPRVFAADRGLAYDLVGQQERAQRDYALALRTNPDDETIRRYALSLGISGQRQRALQLLDPLVRKSDRAAWRAQAFVLAMTGDIGGAQRIAATMMPGGAAGLASFFERLPALPATDRAFAVHFGEVRATPERLADARLAPPLAPLTREPGVLASAAPAPQPVLPARGRARDTRRESLTAAPTRVVQQPALTVASTRVVQQPATAQTPVVVVAAVPTPAVASAVPRAAAPLVAQPPASQPAPAILAAAREPAAGTTVVAAPATTPPATPVIALPERPVPAPVQLASAAPLPQPGFTAAAQPRAVETVALPASAPAVAAVRPAPEPPRASRAQGDAILAKIVAGLSIPGSELGIEEPPRAAAASTPPVASPGRAEAAAVAQADKASLDRIAAARAAADRKAAERKAAGDRKALAEKKAAAEKKALADKEAAEKKRVERANPERVWVQVAGGAYEGDLPKAFAAVKAKAPAVFGSRAGYSTPLRATNRVLTGPFKTDAEARQFVNDLSKAGVSAFTFTSDAGQPVARLGAKGKRDDDDDAPAAKAKGSKPKEATKPKEGEKPAAAKGKRRR